MGSIINFSRRNKDILQRQALKQRFNLPAIKRRKSIFVVDIDEVVFHSVSPLLKKLNKELGTSVKRSELKNLDIASNFPENISREEIRKMIDKYNSLKYISNLRLIKHARYGLERLAKRGKVFFVTCREKEKAEVTIENIEKKLPAYIWEDILCIGRAGKGEIYKKLKPTYVIEDSPLQAEEALKHNIPVLLLDKPWNEELDETGVERMKNWKDIVSYLNIVF